LRYKLVILGNLSGLNSLIEKVEIVLIIILFLSAVVYIILLKENKLEFILAMIINVRLGMSILLEYSSIYSIKYPNYSEIINLVPHFYNYIMILSIYFRKDNKISRIIMFILSVIFLFIYIQNNPKVISRP